ncbi:hypothetical protein D9758_007573 [Tetrapyrgos nigripes]|uniref:Replication termination factor 2 n=1 Tax=Tetrapyrgos nigripes TaxID=182062 RepID=A0A8H5G817_9AGAR|nr:hypothetical protein D9758_007573 [Tetrapyrgos nigripes]
MGNDGGSIPDRRDLVRSKPKAEQADKANQTRARWFFCALSKRPLQEPVVSCALGKLYNKDALLEYLLDKSAYGDGKKICGHIRSLKDVKTLKLTPNTAAPPSTSNGDDSTGRAHFICPLNLKEMNGAQPFIYIATCGCVFSHAGFKALAGSSSSGSSSPKDNAKDKDIGEEIKEEEKEQAKDKDSEPQQEQLDLCPQCASKYSKTDDVLFINPSPEQEERMRARMERLRLLEPAKKSKKRKNAGAGAAEDSEPPTKKLAAASSMNPTISAASRAVVSSLAMEEAKRKANMSEAVKSLYGDGKPRREETFMTRGTFTRYA